MADVGLLDRALRTTTADATERLEAAANAGYARKLPRGATLTPQGRAELARAEGDERAGIDAQALEQVYEKFTVVNASFKALMKDWQVRSVDGADVPNDHRDSAYDASVVDRLAGVDAALTPILKDASQHVPRLSVYSARFVDALAAVRAGDRTMMAAPSRDSYHTVWFEFHQELIDLCGRSRAAEAAAGRGD
jgi:pyruvate,orthophosphate dikinase